MSEDDNTGLITYCGLYCGDCFGHKGAVADLARDLRKELRDSKFKRFADGVAGTSFGKVYRDYDACYEVLGAMVKFRCKRGCRNGGGPPQCKIRNCCRKKGFEGCWECAEFEGCSKLDFLRAVHDDAHLKNLRILAKKGPEEFVRGKRNW